MKYKLNFGSDVIVLPRSALEHLKGASRGRLAVLLSIAAEPTISVKKRAESLALTEHELNGAISFWVDRGVICADGQAAKTASEKKDAAARKQNAEQKEISEQKEVSDQKESAGKKQNDEEKESAGQKRSAGPSSDLPEEKKKRRPPKAKDADAPTALENTTPRLTTPELTGAATEDDNSALLEYCQQKMGHLFNASEAERIVSIRSYLGVSAAFMAMLCDRLKKEGRLTTRSLENTAISLHDGGVVDEKALREFFDRREDVREFESKVRSLFGYGRRSLTAAEKKIVENLFDLGIDLDLIKYAYELTVKNTGGASLKYANAVVEAWIAEGVKTRKQAEEHEKKFKEKTTARSRSKKDAEQAAPSFDTSDFFDNALRRSFGDEFLESYKKKETGKETDGGSGADPDGEKK